MRGRVLILAGTAPARLVCAKVGGLDVVASLAGVTADPVRLGVETRIGGFGGEAGFEAALDGVAAVLDATHPFAERITERAVRVCAERGLPYLRLSRPAWPDRPGWRQASDVAMAATGIGPEAVVFLSTGPGALAPFLGRGAQLHCRRIDPAPERDGVAWVIGRPPFTLAGEMALFRELGVTDLVTKNAGGPAPKLDAAEALGLTIHMIARPPAPGGEETHDIDRAIAFVRKHATDRNRC